MDKTIEQHYLKNYDRLVKRTIYRVPNRSKALAEECVQEAYLRSIKYFPTFDQKRDSFEKWFEGILRNAVNDCRTIEKNKGVTYELIDEDGVELVPYKREKFTAVALLKDISDNRYKAVLSLFLLYGFKTVDIAEHLGMTHTNVRQIIYKYRNKLSDLL
jgi:RNA polymerase sigma factor (sigma-70 family)